MHFQSLFYPASIAIIGASTRPSSVSNDVIRNLQRQGYAGHIYPVNPKGQPILGLTTYPSLAAIGRPVDLAVIITPAPTVPSLMREVASIGIRAVIVISAGFKEVGESGAKLEAEMAGIAKDNDITLIGPNCLGILNPSHDLNISFAKASARSGNVAFVSQSGALCSSVLDYAQEYGIGFSKFVSVGNKACIDEVDLLQELAQDSETDVILLYIEGLSDSARFISSIRQITAGPHAKPVIALKAGRTSEGASASASHTGALAGGDEAFTALFKQSGVIRAHTVEELFIYAAAFAHNGPLMGDRIAIISNAGGPGVLVTDELVARGMKIATFTDMTTRTLRSMLPPAANTHNPVDVLGDAMSDRYQRALDAVIDDQGVDGIITILTPQSMTDIEQIAIALSNTKARTHKPIVASFMGSVSVQDAEGILQRHNVANILFPESAARAMARLREHAVRIELPPAPPSPTILSKIDRTSAEGMLTRLLEAGQRYIPEALALEVIRSYGILTPQTSIVRSREEVHAVQDRLTSPVVLKIISTDIVHKSEVGGVMQGVSVDALDTAFERMVQTVRLKAPKATIQGVLIAQTAPPGGTEYVVGVKKDPSLGHLIMVGLGGIYVEILRDVTFRLAPLSKDDVEEMLHEIKSGVLLAGARGGAPLDRESLIDVILRVSQLVSDIPMIQELDLNPVMTYPAGQGALVLDARLVIA